MKGYEKVLKRENRFTQSAQKNVKKGGFGFIHLLQNWPFFKTIFSVKKFRSKIRLKFDDYAEKYDRNEFQ